MLAVAAIDFLDDALAPIAAGQIQIDVRPRLSAFAQEPLEEQIAGDRIARGDAEAVADRRCSPRCRVLAPEYRSRVQKFAMSQTMRK